MANGCIPKPTFWIFVFYKKLQSGRGQCVYRDENVVVMRKKDGSYQGIGWNPVEKGAETARKIVISLPMGAEEYSFLTETVDEETCNPLKVWHDLGEPACLTEEQRKLLRQAAQPFVQTDRLRNTNACLEFVLSLKRNAVVYFEIKTCQGQSDRGYDYERAVFGYGEE